MARDYFVKVADSYGKHLTGREKAAILFGELGMAGDRLMDYLSDEELRKLRVSLKRLGTRVNLSDEVSALEEANYFGMRHGIAGPIHSDEEIEAYLRNNSSAARQNNVRNMISQNPDAIANALRAWMKGE